jgi:hypothetical protein
VDRRLRLRPVSRLAESKLPGAPIDLSDGKVETKRLYVTKDGIRLKTDSPFMQFDQESDGYQGAAACAAFDNSQAIKGLNCAASAIVELPAPRTLCGVGVIGQFRHELYQNDFLPSIIDYTVEITADGAAWQKVADVKGYIPEEEGIGIHSFEPKSVKAVRVTARNAPGSHHANWSGGQLAFVQLYVPSAPGAGGQ